jgi:hypothetical protein
MLRLDEKSKGFSGLFAAEVVVAQEAAHELRLGSRRSPGAKAWRWAHSCLPVAGLVMLAAVVQLTQGGSIRIGAPTTPRLDDHGRYVPTAPLEAS